MARLPILLTLCVLGVGAGHSVLWLHDAGRDARTPLRAGQLPGVSFPVWTRDGRRVVYRRLDELWSIDTSGSGEERAIPGSLPGDIPIAGAATSTCCR